MKLTKHDHDQVNQALKEADETYTIVVRKLRSVGCDHTNAMLSLLRGAVVYAFIRLVKPSNVVETGVASGFSAHLILQAMELNEKGSLFSIDLPDADQGARVPKGKEIGWLVPNNLRYRWALILGRSQEKLLPLLKELTSIDIFLHNSEHTYETMTFEYETAWTYLRSQGILLSDDIHVNSAFDDFARMHAKRKVAFDGLGAMLK